MDNVIEFYRAPVGSDLADLKPCPFCGNGEIVYAKYRHAAGERWKIICPGCTATIDPGYAQDRKTVQSMWNHRN